MSLFPFPKRKFIGGAHLYSPIEQLPHRKKRRFTISTKKKSVCFYGKEGEGSTFYTRSKAIHHSLKKVKKKKEKKGGPIHC